MSLFTDKNLTQTIDFSYINIYLPSFIIINRWGRAITFFRMLYKMKGKNNRGREKDLFSELLKNKVTLTRTKSSNVIHRKGLLRKC